MTPSEVGDKFFNKAWWNATKFHFSQSLRAVREGMLWVVPCLVFSSMLLFAGSMISIFPNGVLEWADTLFELNRNLMSMFPYLLTSSIAYMLALHYNLPRPPTAIISIALLSIYFPLSPSDEISAAVKIVLAIITPLYSIPLLCFFNKINWIKEFGYDRAGNTLKESLNLILPSLFTALPVIAISTGIISLMACFVHFEPILVNFEDDPYQFGMAFSVLNSAMWFFGIHGYHALLPLVEVLRDAMTMTSTNFIAGEGELLPMNLAFMGSFVFIGGSGATLSLILACLLFTKNKSLRAITIAAIPFGLINVNEILLFGLPIILNPRLFFPFLLAPTINVVTSLLAIDAGFVSVPSIAVPFVSPVFFNALMATNGDFGGVILQFVNVLIGAAIYAPAIKKLDAQLSDKTISIDSLDTTYARCKEKANALCDDPIGQAAEERKAQVALENALEEMNSKEFFVEYQPQFSRVDGRLVGCEALVRARSSKGETEYPGQFMRWLEDGRLLKDLDLWVARQVVSDMFMWEQEGYQTNVSVNISPETLLDDEFMSKIELMVNACKGRISFEITENTMLKQGTRIGEVLGRIHNNGIKISIDDFGTGYSALGYLSNYDVDEIKIDRSFVQGLENKKGKQVLMSLLNFADQLGLSVVIEGVEDQKQLDAIPESPQITIQGWYYSKAISKEALLADFGTKMCLNKAVK